MSKKLKEHRHAATEAEVPEGAPGEAPEPPPGATATRGGLSPLPQSSTRAHGVRHLRNVSRPGGSSGPVAGRGRVDTDPATAFASFDEPARDGRVFVFPGQGAQYVGMGKDLYEAYPAAREVFDRADEILGLKLSKICFQGPEEELQQTKNTQPAIAVTSLALLKVAMQESPSLAPRPGYMAGHSLGEYAALVAAGSLSFDDAVRLLRTRGELMQSAGEQNPGTMAAILGLDAVDCEEVCRESGAELCNLNAPGQVVIGGAKGAVVRALDYAKARGATKVIPLSVSGAFHSSLMKPAADGMVQPVATAAIGDPVTPIIANCSAEPITEENSIRHELVDQVCKPVQWSQTVEYLGKQGANTFIEFGPGRVLTGIIKRMLRKSTCINVNDAASVRVEL